MFPHSSVCARPSHPPSSRVFQRRPHLQQSPHDRVRYHHRPIHRIVNIQYCQPHHIHPSRHRIWRGKFLIYLYALLYYNLVSVMYCICVVCVSLLGADFLADTQSDRYPPTTDQRYVCNSYYDICLIAYYTYLINSVTP